MVAEGNDANWGHVLGLLKTNNDSVRFAGLLLVTKCVPPDDLTKREEVLEAIGGVDYLLRLLLPLRQGRIHPQPILEEDEVDRQIQLAGLGLSIVSNLCLSESVARAAGMERVARVGMGVMRYGPGSLIRQYVRGDRTGDRTGDRSGEVSAVNLSFETQCDMIRDACDCVHLIGGHVDEQAAVSCLQFVAGVNALADEGIRVSTEEQEGRTERTLSCLSSVLRCCLQVKGSSESVVTEVVTQFFSVDGCEAPSASWLQRALKVLEFLDLAAEGGMLDALQPDALSGIREGLRVILASQPPEEPRYQALRVAEVMAARSIDWLLEDMAFFELLVQTVRVEIGVLMLDAVQLDAAVSELCRLEIRDQGQIQESAPGERGVKRQAKDRALMNLPVCFELFELLIEGLCDATALEDVSNEGDELVIGRIFEALTESAELMLQFVELDSGDDGDSGGGDGGGGGGDGADDVGQGENLRYRELLRLGSFRGFCSYASQNPLQFQDRLIRLLEDSELPIRLALPALYGLAIVHQRPIVDSSIALKLMDEAAGLTSQEGLTAALVDCKTEETNDTGYVEVLLEVLLISLRDITKKKKPDEAVTSRAQTYPKEFGVEHALATSSTMDEKVAALAVTARCFVLCQHHESLLRQLIQTCMPDLIDELFSPSKAEVRVSPLAQEMFDGLLASCARSTDISRIELAGNTLVDLCAMFT